MSTLVDNLRLLNSKERFYLIGHILGHASFIPSPTFRAGLANTLKLELPDTVFAAMDYHLDWLQASLYLTFAAEPTHIYPNHDRLIKGQQEDIDFLIAFSVDDSSHIILLEAKGLGAWTNKQMASKAKRLADIFGMERKKWPQVMPHFALVSFTPPQRLRPASWPAWMVQPDGNPYWMHLPIPPNLKRIARCSEQGREDAKGEYWTIVDR